MVSSEPRAGRLPEPGGAARPGTEGQAHARVRSGLSQPEPEPAGRRAESVVQPGRLAREWRNAGSVSLRRGACVRRARLVGDAGPDRACAGGAARRPMARVAAFLDTGG